MSDEATIDTRVHPLTAIRAVNRLLGNPEDTQQVFTIIRAMMGRSGIRAFQRFAASPTGARLLEHRPSLLATLQNRVALAELPAGSVGRAYLEFMEGEKLSAEGLAQASENWESEPLPADMAYFRARMRDAHDLTHVLTGYGRDPLGESCLLAFMYAHTRNRGMALIVAMSWFKKNKAGRRAVVEAWRNGRKAKWLPNQYYEALLARPLEEVRGEIGIVSAARYHTAIHSAAI